MTDPDDTHGIFRGHGSNVKIPILFGVVIALVAANVYLFLQFDQMRTEIATMRDSLLDELSSLRETSTVTSQTQQRRLEGLQEELEAARRQAAVAAGQAKVEAKKRVDELARQVEAEQQRQQQRQEQVREELSQVQQAADAVEARVGAVMTEVEQAKAELDKTISALRTVTGDLGVQSGLIATNAQELSALKALGDRDYYEFDIKKSRQPQKIGDIAVRLNNTEENRNRFAIDVIADDKVVEKKYKTVNEPLQFYVSGVKQPYEMVINEVHKDRIVGYLAVPKVKRERSGAS